MRQLEGKDHSTFCGHMFVYWILIGLKQNHELSQGDILIGL